MYRLKSQNMVVLKTMSIPVQQLPATDGTQAPQWLHGIEINCFVTYGSSNMVTLFKNV